MWTRKDLVKELNKGNPVSINVEINERCAGGCLYCYASSTDGEDLKKDNLSLNKFKEILKLSKFGTKVVTLYGGDQLIHPNIKEIIFHSINEGFHVLLPLAGLIPKSKAEWLVEAQKLAMSKDLEFIIGIHIDTLDQHAYNQVNCFPDSLNAKIKGYETLLNAGFPADRTYGCPALLKQNADTFIPLMNWFYEMGARNIAINPFRPQGLSKEEGAKWEPSLSQLEKAFRHRAKIEGEFMLMVGCSDGKYACQGHFAITAGGDVVPCTLLRDLVAGNIYEEDILEIFKREKKKLLLRINVKGPCAKCVSKLVCYGCRASAHIYLGDITASDPKCFFNPNAPDKCFK